MNVSSGVGVAGASVVDDCSRPDDASAGGTFSVVASFTLGDDPPMETAGSYDGDVGGVRCASPTRAEIAAHSADWTPEKIATYWPTGPHNPAGCADPDGCVTREGETREINPDYRPTLDLRLRVWRDGLELWPRSTGTASM